MAKYRVAVIGCGGIGKKHAQGVAGLNNAEVVAGCDVLQETVNAFREKYAGQWSNISLYTDYKQMLEREQPDVVTIATPDNRHADLVVDSANAGAKGIFCEKPLATNLNDADRMIEVCEENGTILPLITLADPHRCGVT